MTETERRRREEVGQALQALRRRISSSLRAFNDAAPHAAWLRRSEIERLTVELVWAVERAAKRRPPTPVGAIGDAVSWIMRLTAGRRPPRSSMMLSERRGAVSRDTELRKAIS